MKLNRRGDGCGFEIVIMAAIAGGRIVSILGTDPFTKTGIMARAWADRADNDHDWRPCPAEDLWLFQKQNAIFPTRKAAPVRVSKSVRTTAAVPAAATVQWPLRFLLPCSWVKNSLIAE